MSPPRRFPLRPAVASSKPWHMTIKMPKAGGGASCCCAIGPLVWRESGDIFGRPWEFGYLLHADLALETCGSAAVKAQFIDMDSVNKIASSDSSPYLPDLWIDGNVLTFDEWRDTGDRNRDNLVLHVVMTCGDRTIYSNPLYMGIRPS